MRSVLLEVRLCLQMSEHGWKHIMWTQKLEGGCMNFGIVRGVTTIKLITVILSKENLNRAYKKVVANKGASEVDGVTVEELDVCKTW